jgi:hypothetical protein
MLVSIMGNPPRYDYIATPTGDDGLKAVKSYSFPGSSEWLVLSAVVVRASNEPNVASWRIWLARPLWLQAGYAERDAADIRRRLLFGRGSA